MIVKLKIFIKFYNYFLGGLFVVNFFFVSFISCLAETNRTTFDFAEGDSELVSGFNSYPANVENMVSS